jgi:hypothetical protein
MDLILSNAELTWMFYALIFTCLAKCVDRAKCRRAWRYRDKYWHRGVFAGGSMRIWWLVACVALFDSAVVAQQSPPYSSIDGAGGAIQVVTGTFGSLGHMRKLDITARAQDLCGSGAQSCQLFCSETSFGRYALGRKPICRITYRCGADSVRSVEAAREEPILMRCPEQPAERNKPALSSVN